MKETIEKSLTGLSKEENPLKSRFRIGLVQVNNVFLGACYFPYSVGVLQAYAQAHLENQESYEFFEPLFMRMPIKDAADRLKDADAVFFSCYQWNMEYSLKLARHLKSNYPKIRIILGGPSVPNRKSKVQELLLDNRQIDIVCTGEGEAAFLKILSTLGDDDVSDISGTARLDSKSKMIFHPAKARMSDLSKTPSPYLTGIFDRLVENYPYIQWIGLLETNRGCPFGCYYCDWGRSGDVNKLVSFPLNRVMDELEWMAQKHIRFIFCCDANFGILKRDVDIVRYVAKMKQIYGFPHAFSVQNAKNLADRTYDIEKILAINGLSKGVNLAIQTTTPSVLRLIGRKNISMAGFTNLQQALTREGIDTYTDMILGLPGETLNSFIDSCCSLIEGGQHSRIQFNNLVVLPNAPLADPDYLAEHAIETVRSRIINIHGNGDINDKPYEYQDLVVGTASMPQEDWIEARSFGWLVDLFYFNKLFHLPLFVAAEAFGLSYKTFFSALLGDLDRWPALKDIVSFCRGHAATLAKGGEEYLLSDRWLSLWWPLGEYLFIKTLIDGKESTLLEQSLDFLLNLLPSSTTHSDALRESVELNNALLIRPGVEQDLHRKGSYDLWRFYTSKRNGRSVGLSRKPVEYAIKRSEAIYSDWDEWCQQVVWYKHRTGAYYYKLLERNH
ncbi:hypothetical protein DSCO28_03230 [Desulfosarcina ovata subsp. sediminis]|uniref:Uncharacterized protein n=1 Tax=Desulfosarcina ovata subsp. sediminis TaxID=885957 RepID=A0A5K7ZIG4_9BACT|nr:radical SAM protein [Desulfosarcina ovata]BBO79757.1 hypothetical protein DSCO28_03230 [Desulfosarcina ovata subsp. sediminis]